jgi:hypothetical protein
MHKFSDALARRLSIAREFVCNVNSILRIVPKYVGNSIESCMGVGTSQQWIWCHA